MLQVSGRNYLRVVWDSTGLLLGHPKVSKHDEHVLIWAHVEVDAMTWNY